jgi:uncharacterized membrane protein YqjE
MIEGGADEHDFQPSPPGARAGRAGLSGLLSALQNFTASLLAILQTRLELVAVEIEEEWLRLAGFLVLGLICLFCAGMTLLLLTAFVIAVFWDTHRLQAILLLALVFALGGAMLWHTLATRFRNKPAFLGATLAEIGRDCEQLRAQAHEQPRRAGDAS